MKYNSIGEQLITKAKELDPSYKPDKFNDMSEALDVILNNSSGGDGQSIEDLPVVELTSETTTITDETVKAKILENVNNDNYLICKLKMPQTAPIEILITRDFKLVPDDTFTSTAFTQIVYINLGIVAITLVFTLSINSNDDTITVGYEIFDYIRGRQIALIQPTNESFGITADYGDTNLINGLELYFDTINGKPIIHSDNTVNNYNIPTKYLKIDDYVTITSSTSGTISQDGLRLISEKLVENKIYEGVSSQGLEFDFYQYLLLSDSCIFYGIVDSTQMKLDVDMATGNYTATPVTDIQIGTFGIYLPPTPKNVTSKLYFVGLNNGELQWVQYTADDTLSNRVDNLEGRVSSLENEVSQYSGSISSLESRVSSLETASTSYAQASDVSTLDSRVSDIENTIIKDIPPLPSDANTKTYVLKSINGVLTWSE